MKPKLTLVGAGPGDIDLITVKGSNALKAAKVILYDALVNPEFLSFAGPNAICINVGKRKGYHYYSQEEINELIITYGNTHGQVLRLKGGDSFVFGRGYEEVEHAQCYGFDTEVIPGLSSSIAVPASIGIPLTHRSITQSFAVVTGHTSEGQLPKELAVLASTNTTVVILMGMSKLPEIVAMFEKIRGSGEAIGIIQNGTYENQKQTLGTMSTILKRVESINIQNPAVIIIGEVVKLCNKTGIFENIFENLFLQKLQNQV